MTEKSLPRVPEGLRDLMKMYAKEVLREKPENLYKFSADFFNFIVTEKSNRGMRKYEPMQTYETIIKNRIRQQVPLSLVFNIIPGNLTELIKQFIKAVLKESPDNIYIFAQEYFQKLSEATSIHTEYTKYIEYEESLRDKEPFPSVSKVTCQCGRKITAETPEEVQNTYSISSNVIPFNNSTSIVGADPENQIGRNYLNAVIIIQRNFRGYKKQKKIIADKEKYDKEILRAVFMIQRLFRSYLAKKRFENRKDSDKKNRHNDTHKTGEYIKAVIVIQRQFRRYLKKMRQKNQFKEGSFGLVTAAIIIQRAFRRMVYDRRLKGNVPALVDNREELNDISSETCSYNSMSTALLSTESTCAHKEFGNTNSEEFIQNTIHMEEAVDKNNTCLILENEYAATKKEENQMKTQKNDDLNSKEIRSVIEVSNSTKGSITDISDQPTAKEINIENENKATEKSSNDNGDKTEPDALPNKDEQTSVLGSEISEPGESFSHENNGKASGSSDPPKDLDDDLKMNEIQSVLEVSNLTEKSITDTSEQPNGIQLNVEDENKATEKSSNDNGDKTEPDVLPNKDEQSIALGSAISAPGKSFSHEKDGKASGSSDPPKDLDDDLKMNEIQSVLEVSNLTETSITDTSEQPNGIQLNLEDENKATEKSINDNGDKTEPDVLPNKDEQSIVLGSEISEPGKSFSHEKDGKASGSSDPPKDLDDDLKMNEIQSVLEVSNLTETSITDTSEQPNGIQLNLEDENKAISAEKSSNDDGYKTEPDVLPNKNEQSIVLGSEISEPGKSFLQEKDGKAPGSSAPPKDLQDDLKMNNIRSVLEVSNLTETSITDTSEQPNGILLNVEDENKATEKSSNDNGYKTEPDVLPNKDEESTVLGSETSEPGTSFSQEKDGKAPGSSAPPKDLDDDLKMNKILSVLEVSNLTETSITDTSEQPNGIQLNLEDENNATEKSSNDNGDKTDPDVLPNKDEQSSVLGSEISEPGKSFSQEKDGKAPGSSAPPKDLHDDLKMNKIRSVLEVSNLTETSITDTSEQPNGIQLNLEDENNATEKSSNDNGYKTEPDVLPNKDEQSIVLGSEISEPVKSFSQEKDGKAPGSSAPPKDFDDDLKMNKIQSVLEVSNLTEKSITDTSEQPNGIQLNVKDENKATEKSSNDNGNKIQPKVLPNKDERASVLGSEISEPGKSFLQEKDGKAPGSSDSPKDLDDDLKMNKIRSVLEVSNLTETSITDTSEQPNGILLNVEDENKATEKSSNDNGDKTEPDVLPSKDEQSIGSEISEPGKSFLQEKDGKAPGGSASPKDLHDDLKMNEIQSVLEVSKLTETSITDTSEQPNGMQLNVEDENKATEKSSNDNGDKTEPDVLPNKDEQSSVLGLSEISAPGKIVSQEKDGKAPGSSDPPKDLDGNFSFSATNDDLKMNTIRSVLEVSDLSETSITDTSEQPNGIQLNVEDENKATEKSSKDNGDKTEPDVLPNKDEQSIALGSEISAPGKSFSHEKDGKASGSSDPPKDLDDDLQMNEIQCVSEVSNLTETSITDASEQPNGIQLNLEDENKAIEKSINDNGDKTEPDVLPNKDEQSIVLGSEISEPGKSFSPEKDGKAPGSSAPPKDLEDDLKMNKIESVLEVSNLTEKSITDTLEQPNGIQLNVEDENKAIEKSINYNGDKTEPDALPNKDVQSIVLGSEFSEPGSSYWKEKDGKVLGSSTPPKDLDDNMKSNKIQSVMEVSNLTDGSITDIVDNLQDDDNGSAVILDKSSKSVQYRPDVNTGSTLLVSNQLFGTHNFHNVTTVITNKKTNKLPIPKIKHNEIVSAIQKSRFIPRPVAELQLKSFKNLTDKGTWYEINNDFEVNPSSAYADAQTGVLNNTKEVTIKDLGKESSYFMSTETTETDVTKVKRAISYFISFDKSDNENRKYKVPKKLLFKTNAHVQINKQIPLDDSSRSNSLGPHLIINEDKDTEIPTADPDYQQQPGVSKLQTILELNENDLITDNRVTKLKLGLILNESNDVVGSVGDPGILLLSDASYHAAEVVSTQEQVNNTPLKEIQSNTEIELFGNKQNETIEEPCIKKNSYINTNECETKNQFSSDELDKERETYETIGLETMSGIKLDKVTPKSSRANDAVEQISNQLVLSSHDEPVIRTIGSLQEQVSDDLEEGEIIVYNQLQRNETRESSAQSDSVVFGDVKSEIFQIKDCNSEEESARAPLIRHYTIAGDNARSIFRSVTREDTINDIEIGTKDLMTASSIISTNSLFLDDEISENIRKKIMAFSLSETDSDCIDPRNINQENFDIDTAMAMDTLGTSTETESTIVSAATKIQAGARGFLTRRRMRRASAGTKSSTQETKASFGNAAISESFERLIEEEAAKKIQSAYRIHTRKRKGHNRKMEGISLESNLAARRQKLQRGDALRNDSTPEDDNISLTNGGHTQKHSKSQRNKEKGDGVKFKTDMELKWLTLRQNSMPVQIDCNILRVIPKHQKKRIKSAEYKKITFK